MSKQPGLTEEEVEQHLRPAGNVNVLGKDGDSPSAVGEGAREDLRVDANGQGADKRDRDRIVRQRVPRGETPGSSSAGRRSGRAEGGDHPFSLPEARSVPAGLDPLKEEE